MLTTQSRRKPRSESHHHPSSSSKRSVRPGISSGTPLFLQPHRSPAPIQRQSLDTAPAKARKKLSIPSTNIPFAQSRVDQYFEKLKNGNWGASKPAPSGVAIELDGIDKAFLKPMTSIAIDLKDKNPQYASPRTGDWLPVFGPNLVVTLHLDLKKHGLADGSYRFAWIKDKKNQTIYITALSTTPSTSNTPELSKDRTSVTVAGQPFKLSGWEDAQISALSQALSMTPKKALEEISGVKFVVGGGTPPSGEAGHYDEADHTITIYDSAFDTVDSASGQPYANRYGQSTYAVFAIAHEIAHAADMAALRKAYSSKSVKSVKKAQAASGAKWKETWTKEDGKKKRIWQIDERLSTTKKIAFREAALKDGIKVSGGALVQGTSEYGNTDWTELFAENFALYVTAPSTLKLIRPNIHQYFTKKYS